MLYAPKLDARWRARQTDSHDLRTSYSFSYVVRSAVTIAVCSQTHTKHINYAVWAERRICVVQLCINKRGQPNTTLYFK